jgi:hypothetical protein
MLRAVRGLLGSHWTLLSLAGAAVAVVAAGWALLGDGDIVPAALALLLGLSLVGTAVSVAATRAAGERIRSLEARLGTTASATQENTDALGEIRATLTESVAHHDRIGADLRTDLGRARGHRRADQRPDLRPGSARRRRRPPRHHRRTPPHRAVRAGEPLFHVPAR